MKKPYIAVLATAFLIIYAATGFADDHNFKAVLTGGEEVPPVTTDTTGKAKFKFNEDFTKIDFTLEIKNAHEILGATGAHIHCAPAGINGGVVAFLAGVVTGGFDGKVSIEATLTDANIADVGCGANVFQLLQSMADGDTYVNVHSLAFPGGEIRGQIQ